MPDERTFGVRLPYFNELKLLLVFMNMGSVNLLRKEGRGRTFLLLKEAGVTCRRYQKP